MIIWYAGFYTFGKLKEYWHTIKNFEDGKAFRSIMIGMGILAYGLVLPTAISLILQSVATHHPGFKPASVIISNYINILVLLITFTYISNGTRLFISMGKNQPGLAGMRIFILLFIGLSVVFTYLVMHYHIRHTHVYYLNTPLLLITFVIPYLFGWFMAFLSAYEFHLYAKYSKGLLYRQALRQFSYGIVATISGSVASQFIRNTVAAKARHSLKSVLIIEYALLAIITLGLTLMALSAKKLKKIEEV